MNPELSIVILTKNQDTLFQKTIEAVLAQKIDRRFETIVIDSSSQDKTAQLCQHYPIRLLRIPPREFGHGSTRNQGALIANGRYIIFLNADAIPKNTYWAEQLLKNFFQYEKVAGVYSKLLPRPGCNPLLARDIIHDTYLQGEVIKYIRSFCAYQRMSSEEKRKFVSFHTISCAIDRQILLEYPFADVIFGEDLVWSKQVLEKGFKIIYEPSSQVYHSHQEEATFFKTMQRYYDDTRLNQLLLRRWNFSRLLKLPLLVAAKSFKDIFYITSSEERLLAKFYWCIRSPFLRIAEFLGVLIARFPYLSARLSRYLSSVERIKQE